MTALGEAAWYLTVKSVVPDLRANLQEGGWGRGVMNVVPEGGRGNEGVLRERGEAGGQGTALCVLSWCQLIGCMNGKGHWAVGVAHWARQHDVVRAHQVLRWKIPAPARCSVDKKECRKLSLGSV